VLFPCSVYSEAVFSEIIIKKLNLKIAIAQVASYLLLMAEAWFSLRVIHVQ
jgi:hypothetical protein